MSHRLLWTFLAVAAAIGASCGARAQGSTTPPDPASAQPSLPKPMPKLTMPDTGNGSAPRHHHQVAKHRTRSAHRESYAGAIERPALANVELLAPLPHPPEPPHVTVPLPAYPLETFVTAYTTPPPPVVCHRTRRDPAAPDPHLLYEKTVVCEADNP